MKTNYLNATMLDIVFEHRNKAFGAYVLRRDYNQSVSRAMLIMLSSVFLFFFSNFVREHLKPTVKTIIDPAPWTPADPSTLKLPPAKPITPPKTAEAPAPKPTIKDPEMRVVAQARASDSVTTNEEIKADPGITTTNPPNGNDLGAENGKGKGTVFEVQAVKEEPLRNWAEVMPEYPGGEKALLKFLAENTDYPAMEKDNGIGGKVVTQFTVNEDGSISDIGVVKSAGTHFDKEVTRVIKILKPFKPGMQGGKPVKVRYVLPFTFKTND